MAGYIQNDERIDLQPRMSTQQDSHSNLMEKSKLPRQKLENLAPPNSFIINAKGTSLGKAYKKKRPAERNLDLITLNVKLD